ncbi:MAG TPA: transcription elongation factor GreA [Anaerohalosphaeraceae bacterium]|nr:transcription elongation factor GreA [Anaerohalosphaeraceae bacterium]HOL88432.1 transcription elongation factor GreA [Anaerohalosphaeraceae bacterium]HPP57416.1 transcription elongation factor GreA [Anaerohalosphaeraceae bacterium]
MPEIMPISQTGYEKLREELRSLEKEAVEVRQRVAEAREQGDLRENGEYIYGRQQLGFIEGRMAEIRGKLNFSKTIDCTQIPTERAGFGTVVKVKDLDTGKIHIYHLLGPYDSDLTDDSISILSPVGQALNECTVGSRISVQVPRGELHLEVLEIQKSPIR